MSPAPAPAIHAQQLKWLCQELIYVSLRWLLLFHYSDDRSILTTYALLKNPENEDIVLDIIFSILAHVPESLLLKL